MTRTAKLCPTTDEATPDLPPTDDDPKLDPPIETVNAVDGPGTVDRPVASATQPRELGGRPGPDPTRYGDWELKGRCIDF